MKYLAFISLFLGFVAMASFSAEGGAYVVQSGPSALVESSLTHGKLTGLANDLTTADDVTFEVIGVLGNSCRRPGRTVVYYDPASRTFAVNQMVQTFGEVCLQRVMPFSITVNLGRLVAGSYRIQLGQDTARARSFKVSPNTTELL